MYNLIRYFMRMRRVSWMLMAVVLGLGMSVASCKDDNGGTTEEQQEQETQENALKFWHVVGQLVSVDDVTEDYEGKTFEPTYGLPDETNSLTRIVNTNDMRTAAQRFANLIGAKDIDEHTASYTWSDPDIGTMTYTRGGTPAEWATVEVNIKQVPQLQKIIYREGGEGDNGRFSGKAYYRFGDVVSRQVPVTFNQKKNNDHRGTITEYWICVRPAFGPEKKEDSHWVCVNTVSDKNYKYYKASTGTEYWLPTLVEENREHMQNFAELLWAITQPEQWFSNVFNHHTDGTLWGFDGVPFFYDFKGANLKLHNQYFWQNVQNGWESKQIAERALNMPSLAYLVETINQNGVHLLYNGYSWYFTSSWYCRLWEAVYTNGKSEEELNMHHAEYNEEVERHMKDLTFDVRTMGQNKDNYNGFFNNDGKYRWVIRHATGKELASNKKFDVKKPIEGVTEVYRYYRDVLPMTDLAGDPEITGNNDALTPGYYRCGDIVKYKNRYYVCASKHDKGKTARFITLNDQESHTKMEFPWKENGEDAKDVVYSDDMASVETVAAWVTNILMDDDKCESIRNAMSSRNASDFTFQVVPQTEAFRQDLVKRLLNTANIITDASQPSPLGGGIHSTAYSWQTLFSDDASSKPDLELYAPTGYLLVDKMRYSTHIGSETEHWVPYLFLYEEKDSYTQTLLPYLQNDETQSTSHFQWQSMGMFQANSNKLNSIISGSYHVLKLAFAWMHYSVSIGDHLTDMLFDFTKNWEEHPNPRLKQYALECKGAWTNHNITTREFTFTDNGKKNSSFESISVASER